MLQSPAAGVVGKCDTIALLSSACSGRLTADTKTGMVLQVVG